MGLIFGGEYVLVIKGAYIRGAYIRDFTVFTPKKQFHPSRRECSYWETWKSPYHLHLIF